MKKEEEKKIKPKKEKTEKVKEVKTGDTLKPTIIKKYGLRESAQILMES